MNSDSRSIPENLSAAAGNTEGEINLQWEPVKGARYYVIQSCTGSSKWKEIDIVTKTIYTASRLMSGKVYGFRVAAVNSSGLGKWSETVNKKSP